MSVWVCQRHEWHGYVWVWNVHKKPCDQDEWLKRCVYTHILHKVDKLFLNWYTQLNLNCLVLCVCLCVWSYQNFSNIYGMLMAWWIHSILRIYKVRIGCDDCTLFTPHSTYTISRHTMCLAAIVVVVVILLCLIWTIFQIQKIQIKSIAIIEFFGNEFLGMPKRNPKSGFHTGYHEIFTFGYQWNHIISIENSL